MPVTTVSASDFARHLVRAKQAAEKGPVIVTDRGRPRYALLKIEGYCRLAATEPLSLLAVMDAIPAGEFDFEPPKLSSDDLKPADFS